jgi:TonB family protein
MNPDTTPVPEDALGSLKGCLIDGDPQQQRRARNIRRRSIFCSVVLQFVAVTALVIFPLLGNGERIPIKIFVESPPYRFGSDHPDKGTTRRSDRPSTQPCLFCKSTSHGKPTVRSTTIIDREPADPPGFAHNPFGDANGVRNVLESATRTPARPPSDQPATDHHRRIVMTHIDPSHITRRAEPIYPPLGVQLHRETRVELHAIIAKDGSIQSLQVISGDALFYQSAIEAVRQWRYTPTLLNDQPVEVDTEITVIYTLNR